MYPFLIKIIMKRYCILLFLLILHQSGFSQLKEEDEIYKTLQAMDSLLFERAYNHVDTAVLRDIVSENLEMYHDQQGMLKDRESLIQAMGSLGQLPFKSRRELVPGSLVVFPMHNQGKLYGALQYGEHTFYAKEEGKPEHITSVAKFMSLWLIEDGHWRLSRALSYDHQAPID